MTNFIPFLCLMLAPFASIHGVDVAHSNQASIDKAEEFFQATLYQQAIPLYQQSYDLAPSTNVAFRLGQSFFYEKNYAEATHFFEKSQLNELSTVDKENLLLMLAASYRDLNQPARVVDVLKEREWQYKQNDAEIELGLAYFLLGQQEASLKHFESAFDLATTTQQKLLASLYLIRLSLAAQDFEKAEFYVARAERNLDDSVLQNEFFFLNGELAYQQQNYQYAIELFEKSLAHSTHNSSTWENDALYNLGWSYLKLASLENTTKEQKQKSLQKAEELFSNNNMLGTNEKLVLALAQTYLAYAKFAEDASYKHKVEPLFTSFQDKFSDETRLTVALLRAEAIDDYQRRQAVYNSLLESENLSKKEYARIYYLNAVNDYEEAAKHKQSSLYVNAAKSFKQAQHYQVDEKQNFECLKCYVQALWEADSIDSRLEAIHALHQALKKEKRNEQLNELYRAYVVRIIREDISEGVLKQAEATLKEQASDIQNPRSVLALAAFYSNSGQYEQAYSTYVAFVKANPTAVEAPYALLQASFSLENLKAPADEVRTIRQQIFKQFSTSEVAPQAYFLYYSLQDYLQGDRLAIKHLNTFKEKFPNSPLLINAYYLMGLDLKRDRRTLEGKWVRKKNSSNALQSFGEAEATFDRLMADRLIPSENHKYYIKLRYRSLLEKALIHYEIAEESSAAKRQIYLQYAIDTLKSLKENLEAQDHPLTQVLMENDTFCSLHEECLYWLTSAFFRTAKEEEANNVIGQMMTKYEAASISSGYYLSRIRYEQAMSIFNAGQSTDALALFLKAEEASKGKYLSVEEKLDLWIKQSECYHFLGQIENAMLVLSKVINDDSISHQRLKAMFMRATLYEKLGRPELARRQLEAVAKMGGEWAVQAKIKLDQEYGSL